jgi:hypothetical protein
MVEKQQCYVENVGGVDENTPSTSYVHMLCTSIHTPTSFVSNVENVHLQTPNMSNDDISQLVGVEMQVVA